jgi:hypothetical protein
LRSDDAQIPASHCSRFRRRASIADLLAGRPDVLVDAEEVRRIVLLLDLGEARIAGAERGSDGVGAFLAQEIQEIAAARISYPSLRLQVCIFVRFAFEPQ